MSYIVLARKYRPQTFDQVVGQAHVTQTLTHAIEAHRLAHAILFSGPRGTGKTTVARILAKAMNCEKGPLPMPCNQCQSCTEITAGSGADVFEIDGASNNSVDQVRELRDNLRYLPTHSRYKIYIIDEVHMLSLSAFNALLKTLEEPPAHILFMFATTEAHKIPITILSRCQRHDLRRIESVDIARHLKMLCEKEGNTVDDDSLALIAQEAGGSMRDALSLMDHVLACAQGPVTVRMISDLLGVVERDHLFHLSRAVFDADISEALKCIDEVWRNGYEINRFYSDLVTHFHHLTLVKIGGNATGNLDLPSHEVDRMQRQVAAVDPSVLLQLFDLLFQAEAALKMSSQPKFALEMVFLKLFQTPSGLAVDTLIDKLDALRDGIIDERTAPVAPLSGPPESAVAEASATTLPHSGSARLEEDQTPSTPLQIREEVPQDREHVWDRLIEQVTREKPSLAALLKKCKLTHNADSQIEIEVRGNDFSFKSIKKHQQMLEKLCCELVGQSVNLSLKSNIEDQATKQKKKEKTAQLEQKALSHPLVMEALKLFDGKVVDVNIP